VTMLPARAWGRRDLGILGVVKMPCLALTAGVEVLRYRLLDLIQSHNRISQLIPDFSAHPASPAQCKCTISTQS
jgi:hypothetical protein